MWVMKTRPRYQNEYPRFYFYGRYDSDREWILKMMWHIPLECKKEISDEYERLYKAKENGGRKVANTYLHTQAKKFRGQ